MVTDQGKVIRTTVGDIRITAATPRRHHLQGRTNGPRLVAKIDESEEQNRTRAVTICHRCPMRQSETLLAAQSTPTELRQSGDCLPSSCGGRRDGVRNAAARSRIG